MDLRRATAPALAAVVVVCGHAQGGDEEAEIAERLAKQDMSVSVYHSADDSVIPVAAGDAMVEAVRRVAAAASTTAPRYRGTSTRPGRRWRSLRT